MFKEGNELHLLLLWLGLVTMLMFAYAIFDRYASYQIELEAIRTGLVQSVSDGKIIWVFKAQ